MKNIPLFILLALLATFSCTTVDTRADEEAVRQAWNESVVAYNNRDFETWRGFIAEDYQDWAGGRQALENLYKNAFENQKGARYKQLEELGITFVTPTVAIYKSRGENSGFIDRDGNPIPPSNSLGAWVWEKKDGKWLCAALFSRNLEE